MTELIVKHYLNELMAKSELGRNPIMHRDEQVHHNSSSNDGDYSSLNKLKQHVKNWSNQLPDLPST